MSRAKTKIQDIWLKYKEKLDLLDINLIISFVIKKPKEFIFAHPEHELITNYQLPARLASPPAIASEALRAGESVAGRRITNYIKRRIKGEPLAYIMGSKEFYGLHFRVNKNVLVPRPETEMMVEETIKRIAHNTQRITCLPAGRRITHNMEPITIVDVGTGSGNIIISVAKTLNNFKFKILNLKLIGTDISEKALQTARRNAKTHKLDKQIKFLKGDLLNPIIKNQKIVIGNCELIIVANLPYLDIGWKNLLKSAETKGLKFEPQIALYAGKDGLDAYRRLAEQIKILKEKTSQPITVFCEIGCRQAKEMKKIFSFAKNVEIKKDLAGLDRLVIIEIL